MPDRETFSSAGCSVSTGSRHPVICPFAWREEISGAHQHDLKTYQGECDQGVEQALRLLGNDGLQRAAEDADLLIRLLAHPQAQGRGAREFGAAPPQAGERRRVNCKLKP